MEWSKTKKYNPNGPGYPEAGYWYVLQSEAEERIEKLQAEVARLRKAESHHPKCALRGKLLCGIAPMCTPCTCSEHIADARMKAAEAKLLAVEGYVDGLDGLPGSKMWRIWQDIKTLLEARDE